MPILEFTGKFPDLEELIGDAIRPGVVYLYAAVENMAVFQGQDRGEWEMTRNPTTFSVNGNPAILMCRGEPIPDVDSDSMVATVYVDNDLYNKAGIEIEEKPGGNGADEAPEAKVEEAPEEVPSEFISACGTPHPKGLRSKRMHELHCRECQRILAQRGG